MVSMVWVFIGKQRASVKKVENTEHIASCKRLMTCKKQNMPYSTNIEPLIQIDRANTIKVNILAWSQEDMNVCIVFPFSMLFLQLWDLRSSKIWFGIFGIFWWLQNYELLVRFSFPLACLTKQLLGRQLTITFKSGKHFKMGHERLFALKVDGSVLWKFF